MDLITELQTLRKGALEVAQAADRILGTLEAGKPAPVPGNKQPRKIKYKSAIRMGVRPKKTA